MPLPELDDTAALTAHLAFLEPAPTIAEGVENAIRAYLWAKDILDSQDPDDGWVLGPSLNDYRAAKAQT